MDGGAIARKGPRAITVVRIDPSLWRVDVFHHAASAERPADIEEWKKRTGAAVMLNAGQYYPNQVPMGLFIKDGKNLGTPLLKNWKGLLVAEPAGDPGARRADILDLQFDAYDPAAFPWRTAVQSFMLIDRTGARRVRRSDWHANRTILATDERARLLVIHTEGACTLWELAGWIHDSDLDVRHALSLDGGFEAQLAIQAGAFTYVSRGSWHVDDRGDHSIPGVRMPLPAVIGLFPR
jgi:uncharacterized protein YigE (DUF2233 family)